jgi:hypothetical protein
MIKLAGDPVSQPIKTRQCSPQRTNKCEQSCGNLNLSMFHLYSNDLYRVCSFILRERGLPPGVASRTQIVYGNAK